MYRAAERLKKIVHHLDGRIWYEVKQDLKKRWNVSNLVSRFSLSTITMGRFKNRVYCQEAEDILPFANHPPHTDALLFDYQFEEAADNTLEHYY